MLLLLKVNTNEENGHEFSSFIHKLLGIFEGYDFAIMLFKNQLKQNKRENLTDPSLGIVLMSEWFVANPILQLINFTFSNGWWIWPQSLLVLPYVRCLL